jgi:hypothetical protein
MRRVRARAEERFSARRMAEQYAALYERLRVPESAADAGGGGGAWQR